MSGLVPALAGALPLIVALFQHGAFGAAGLVAFALTAAASGALSPREFVAAWRR